MDCDADVNQLREFEAKASKVLQDIRSSLERRSHGGDAGEIKQLSGLEAKTALMLDFVKSALERKRAEEADDGIKPIKPVDGDEAPIGLDEDELEAEDEDDEDVQDDELGLITSEDDEDDELEADDEEALKEKEQDEKDEEALAAEEERKRRVKERKDKKEKDKEEESLRDKEDRAKLSGLERINPNDVTTSLLPLKLDGLKGLGGLQGLDELDIGFPSFDGVLPKDDVLARGIEYLGRFLQDDVDMFEGKVISPTYWTLFNNLNRAVYKRMTDPRMLYMLYRSLSELGTDKMRKVLSKFFKLDPRLQMKVISAYQRRNGFEGRRVRKPNPQPIPLDYAGIGVTTDFKKVEEDILKIIVEFVLKLDKDYPLTNDLSITWCKILQIIFGYGVELDDEMEKMSNTELSEYKGKLKEALSKEPSIAGLLSVLKILL